MCTGQIYCTPQRFHATSGEKLLMLRIRHYNISLQVAYTYDAGPNACLYLLEKDVPLIMSLVRHFYSPENGKDSFTRGPEIPFIEISQVKMTFFSMNQSL